MYANYGGPVASRHPCCFAGPYRGLKYCTRYLLIKTFNFWLIQICLWQYGLIHQRYRKLIIKIFLHKMYIQNGFLCRFRTFGHLSTNRYRDASIVTILLKIGNIYLLSILFKKLGVARGFAWA